MNCLYITLFFNIVAGIVQTFIKSWNELLYPRVIEVFHLPLVIRDQRWSTAPLFVVNISSSFREFTAPLRQIMPIYNVTINRKDLFVNFLWTFTFCVEKPYDGAHLSFGGTLDRRCHFKDVSHKQSRFYCCQTSTAYRYRIKFDGIVAIINIKNFPLGLNLMYLYFPDTPGT